MNYKDILEYQKFDIKIRKIDAEIRNSDDRKNATKMQEYLKDSQSKLIKLEETSDKLVKHQEKAIASYNDFVSKLESTIKDSEPKNPNEVRMQMEKLNAFHTACVKLEKDIESLKSSLEKVSAEFDNLMKNSKTAKGNFEVYKNRFNELKKKYEPELLALTKERDNLVKNIDPEMLTKYKHKAESKNPVFVPSKDNTCGGCRMEISGAKVKSLKENGLIECENCGRFIYLV